VPRGGQRAEHRACDARHCGSGDPQHADGTTAGRARDRGNGIERFHPGGIQELGFAAAWIIWLMRHCCTMDSTVLVSQ
jgi:hypothetical protein